MCGKMHGPTPVRSRLPEALEKFPKNFFRSSGSIVVSLRYPGGARRLVFGLMAASPIAGHEHRGGTASQSMAFYSHLLTAREPEVESTVTFSPCVEGT